MEDTTAQLGSLTGIAKNMARQFLTMGENRLELLTVEVQEGRERLLLTFQLALAVAAFGLLAGIALTAALVLLFWDYGPLTVLLLLFCAFGLTGACLCRKLVLLLRDWQTLPSSLDQLRKDRACLERLMQ